MRTRDNVVHGMHKLADVRRLLAQERDDRSLRSILGDNSVADTQQQEGGSC